MKTNLSYMKPSSTPFKEMGRILGTLFSSGGLDSTGALPEALVSPELARHWLSPLSCGGVEGGWGSVVKSMDYFQRIQHPHSSSAVCLTQLT